jgi:hypothetical protein
MPARSSVTLAAALTWAFGTAAVQAADMPQMNVSLILDGLYYNELRRGHGTPAGFGDGHQHGDGHGLDEGFNLGHSELALDARLGDFMDGALTLGFDEDHVEVEEAWVRTRSLPAGLQFKAGKFLSDAGYINSRHPHEWDFVDRPLVNEYLFGDHGLQEIGVQATYLLATAWFTRVGIELLQGNGEGINLFDSDGPRDRRAGPRIVTLFARTGPDLGPDHALQLGISGGYSSQYARVEDDHAVHGNAWFAGVDAVYKYDAGRSYGHGDFRFAGEYFHTGRSVHFFEEQGGSWEREDHFRERQDGMYVEGVYGVAPRWEAGLRLEALGLANRIVDLHDEELESFGTSYRHSMMVTFRPVEPVFLRAQISQRDFADDHGRDRGLDFMLQLNVALGAHGAHRF